MVTPDEKYIISGDYYGEIKIWDLKTFQEIKTLEGHFDQISSIVLLSNNKYIISASYDRTIRLWDITSGKELQRFEGYRYWIFSLTTFFNDRYIAFGYGGIIKIWDIKNKQELAQLISFKDEEWLAFTSDNYYNCSKNAKKYFFFQDNTKEEIQFLPSLVYEKFKKFKITLQSDTKKELKNETKNS